MRFILGRAATFVMRAGGLLRRPEILVFLPAVTLAAFWLGGEELLTIVALGLPMVFVMTGAIGLGGQRLPPRHEGFDGMADHRLLVTLLDDALRGAVGRDTSVACVVLQFDEPERLVERYGLALQSDIVSGTADRLLAVLRAGDIIARLEGGGFGVALIGVRRLDLETMVQLAARIQAAVSAPLAVSGMQVMVTCSVGFCLASRLAQATGRTLLDAAQVAADVALRNGPGAVRSFSPGMAVVRADHAAQRDELETALDEGRIRAHFQPQVSTDTGEITGFEALARWHHADRGLVSPAEFLPAIDDAGLSERLSEVMLYNALTALARWDKAGLAIPTVAVNFSASELRNPRLPEKIKWELDRFELEPQRLTIEILETVITRADNDVLVRNVAALSALGCGVDLDDFGTGHASITSIRRLQLRRLKIDRSFVARVDEDRGQQQIVSAILSMAERLGLDTLAEGVETPGEHAMLAQLGCGHVQGFGVGRPMPFEETADWVLRHRARQATTPRIRNRAG
jgi:EAL domain-containing protein (putative c-di-GMP-specific phosphodiesterase class I)/GGDEF domain-containing protein